MTVENNALSAEKEKLSASLKNEQEASRKANEEVRKLSGLKATLDKQVKELQKKLADSEGTAGDLGAIRKQLESEIVQLKFI